MAFRKRVILYMLLRHQPVKYYWFVIIQSFIHFKMWFSFLIWKSIHYKLKEVGSFQKFPSYQTKIHVYYFSSIFLINLAEANVFSCEIDTLPSCHPVWFSADLESNGIRLATLPVAIACPIAPSVVKGLVTVSRML